MKRKVHEKKKKTNYKVIQNTLSSFAFGIINFYMAQIVKKVFFFVRFQLDWTNEAKTID